jgi:hypothetical protein
MTAADFDYEALGLVAGLEIHQQLDTATKLFCECPTELREPEEADHTFRRYLHPTKSELGEIDEAALEESMVDREFEYLAYDTTCLVEEDDEPPHRVDREAMETAMEIGQLMDMNVVDQVNVMRKIVVDGSNTTGFQRSMMVANDGVIQTDDGPVGIEDMLLEEESCQRIEETEDGVWHGAAYPARTTSTFAIAVDEGTWRQAGIDDRGGSETIAFLEDIFADHLDGHGLRSKEDQWRRFLTVETEQWYNDNVVLLGDAAHTAHYTIGSGTRMAVEDAIVLAECLDESPGEDRGAAFERYQSRRKPHVEALQAAADLSVTHFEHLPRYVHLDPEALAFLYLTRTGSNSYEDLQSRDPTFTDRIDRWFAERAGGDPSLDPAGQPLSLADVTVPWSDAAFAANRAD